MATIENIFRKLIRADKNVGIDSISTFRSILERECSRAERNSHGFSLVIFNSGSVRRNFQRVQELTGILKERIRATDVIGWVDSERIAVLLPETYRDGARKFAQDVTQETQSRSRIALACTVQIYPPNQEDGNKHVDPPSRRSGKTKGVFKGRIPNAPDANPRNPVSTGLRYEGDAPSEIKALYVRPLPLWKRLADVIGSLMLLILFSPLFIFTAVLIRIASPGPIFFKQVRVGYLERRFVLWKFRTMKVNSDTSKHQAYLAQLIKGQQEGGQPMEKLDDVNSQIIPFGKILRKSAIDELPQLINVLLGEMSLVGPRPSIPYEVEEFRRWHCNRFDAVPGMTGLWQVSGKNRLTFHEMVRLDIRYSKSLSFWEDMRILLMTPVAIVNQIMDSIGKTPQDELNGGTSHA